MADRSIVMKRTATLPLVLFALLADARVALADEIYPGLNILEEEDSELVVPLVVASVVLIALVALVAIRRMWK
jgi:putative effector of murein hydrolase